MENVSVSKVFFFQEGKEVQRLMATPNNETLSWILLIDQPQYDHKPEWFLYVDYSEPRMKRVSIFANW